MTKKQKPLLSKKFSKKLMQFGALVVTVLIGNFLYNNAERYLAGHLACENKVVYITIGALGMFLLIILLNYLEVMHEQKHKKK